MAIHQAVTPHTAENPSFSLMLALSLPWLDRTIAIIACVPIVWITYYRLEHWHMGIPLISYVAVTLLLIVTMIVRRPPVRVTPNPLYWLLAFVATYWSILVLSLFQPGRSIASQWVTDALSVVGLVITVWARLSLGRNIGFVPAQRELVSTGAYAYMRHPIYTGMLFMYLAFALRAYTPRNALLFALGLLWFIPIKSLVEESFLRCDPEYAAYMRKVRARWIPFVV
jgi:protein-S-isoprenylcysteine O-methyltransferase Ste14